MKVTYDLIKTPALFFGRIVDALNRNITFEDNFRAVKITVADSGPAATEFTVTHNLGKTPTGYIVTSDVSVIVIDSSVASWDESVMYLKCTTANAALRLVIF